MTRRLLLFLGGSLAFWLLLALPARHLWGDSAAVTSGVCMLLCLVPTSLTLIWASRVLDRSPDQQMVMVLGGTGIRMFVVLAAAMALTSSVPYFQDNSSFWTWLLVCYLFTLALEMVLLLTGRSAATIQPERLEQNSPGHRPGGDEDEGKKP